MAASDSAPWQTRPAAQAVASSIGASTYGVQCQAWGNVMPDLPPEVAAMLAPPISVSSAPLSPPQPVDARRQAELARYRLNMAAPPNGRHRRPARTS